jgi:cell division protein FtsI (penicillin-binding protein 3)
MNVDSRVTLKRRTTVAAVVLGLWAVGIEARLVTLQIFERAELSARAARQQQRTIPAPARRGDILDRRGRVLATSVDSDSIYAVPSAIEDESATVKKLCAAFRDCTAKERRTLLERLGKQRAFAYIRRQVSPDVARRVAALKLDGVDFLKESQRFYPNRELAAHLLGWAGIDNTGLGGIEAAYDAQIHGKDGRVLIHADARRQAFDRLERPPVPGSSIELTIDAYLQHVAERELRGGVVENRAVSGSAILMNPRTGEILAMANEPTFNPNAYRDAGEDQRRNRAVQDLYEPGSTFKLVTVSAALEERVMPVETAIDTSPGRITIGSSRVVTEANNHDYGVLSFTDVLVRSSNVGAIKIGFEVGTDRLSRFVRRFGFGQAVSPDFPGENRGIVWDRSKWTDSALASVSMGYQVGVTPLQMAAAVGAVANRGEYVQPRVLRAVYRGGRRLSIAPKIAGRPISANTAAVLTTIMEQVVERGTGTLAQIPGYTIAGKTGTANKLVNGRYSNETYASFVGFAPSRNPAIAVIVVIDTPRGNNGHFGGSVAAPIFRRITEAALLYLGVAPTINPAAPVLAAPRTPEPARAAAAGAQEPLVDLIADGGLGTVPDVRGLSARDATRRLARAGFAARLAGDGLVVSQQPAPGSAVEAGGVCLLVLDRSLAPAALGTLP